MNTDQYDVVISGGGMVGASLACALRPLALRVAVVEAGALDSAAPASFDDRSIALSRSSQRILAGIGVWPDLAAQACPIRRVHVSERGRFGTAVIDGDEQQIGDLGYVLGSRTIGAVLWRQMAAAGGIDLLSPATLQAPQADGGQMRLTLRMKESADAAPRELSCRLLVVAEGTGSGLRDALGIAATQRSYGQTAIVGNVAVEDCAERFTAYERFTADGPVALLPFHDGRFIFVMARSTEAAEMALTLAETEFLQLLQTTFGERVGRFTRLGERHAWPLSLLQAARVTAPRAVIVGNAAHGLHPIAAQGYNLGLRDAAALAEVIADAVRSGEDPGDPAALERYARWRERDQRNVVTFTDGLIRLFELKPAALGIARGLGLMAFDLLPGARRELARRTMGLSGRLTRLARGLPL